MRQAGGRPACAGESPTCMAGRLLGAVARSVRQVVGRRAVYPVLRVTDRWPDAPAPRTVERCRQRSSDTTRPANTTAEQATPRVHPTDDLIDGPPASETGGPPTSARGEATSAVGFAPPSGTARRWWSQCSSDIGRRQPVVSSTSDEPERRFGPAGSECWYRARVGWLSWHVRLACVRPCRRRRFGKCARCEKNIGSVSTTWRL